MIPMTIFRSSIKQAISLAKVEFCDDRWSACQQELKVAFRPHLNAEGIVGLVVSLDNSYSVGGESARCRDNMYVDARGFP